VASVQFSLEQYACLCAELRSQPGREAGVLTKYGLDGAGYERLTGNFSSSFIADPAVEQRFLSLVEFYGRSMQRR
jgi:hypothetical protein